MHALIIVDVQPDFCPGGPLATSRGDEVAGLIAQHVADNVSSYDAIVSTQDWHIDPGSHFSRNPDFVDSWPVHCVAGTDGAKLHPLLAPIAENIEGHFLKGEYSAAYSGFEGHLADSEQTLAQWLHARGITTVDVCGIATDFCVKATASDALANGFGVTVLSELCSAVAQDSGIKALQDLADAGARIQD
ncbi:isochorismatase family protein [Corynebacterium aquilae]|uniref:nicotinamidase n=1 Tax=Corynebacterium aquilae DSM 44791 TaxID=1431546 RepID=A0A1L7CHP7_9CORY|nr:isochorismatase family protein [Corynebacterium aquilae]APT85293.1 amidase [Corynebacterium aquilae DSM 44791]